MDERDNRLLVTYAACEGTEVVARLAVRKWVRRTSKSQLCGTGPPKFAWGTGSTERAWTCGRA
eukprot:3970609-Prorocentrum_lima.AAC.1